MLDDHICGNKCETIIREWKILYIAYPNTTNSPVFSRRREIDIDSCHTACGFGVPLMTMERPRSTLTDYWLSKGEADTAAYRDKHNRVSIDGLPTGWGEG